MALDSTGMCARAGINGCKVDLFCKYDGVCLFSTSCALTLCKTNLFMMPFLFAHESVSRGTHAKQIMLLRRLAGKQLMVYSPGDFTAVWECQVSVSTCCKSILLTHLPPAHSHSLMQRTNL